MSKPRPHLRLALLPALLAFLAACGGGGGSSSGAPLQPQSTMVPVSAGGVVTGFSSVYVNGTRYELDDRTRVQVDDDPERLGDDSSLRLGMRVSVSARRENGRRVAEKIEYRRDLKGPVVAVVSDTSEPELGEFVVGQTRVRVDANTVFDTNVGDNDGAPGIDIRDLDVPGMVVAVSGFATATGYLATRVSRLIDDDADEIEIKGFVAAVDLTGGTLTVQGTTFAVTGATVFEDGLGFDDDLVGRFVEVEGVLVGADWEVVKVEAEDDHESAGSGEFEIEGILIAVDTSVTPHRVQIGGRTLEVRDASALVDLVGTKVEMEGSIDAAGVLVLREVEVESREEIRLEDQVTLVDAAAGTFTTRLGLVIRPDGMSRLEGAADDQLTPARFLNQLRAGDSVRARGALAASGQPVWTRVVFEAEGDDGLGCELRGPVEQIAADESSIEILGVVVDVSGSGVEFESAAGMPVDREVFFAALTLGDLVEAESDDDVNGCQDGLLIADEVERRQLYDADYLDD